MATEKQIEANRRNAKKSTGPKTEEGKAVASQNSLTHGLTVSRVSKRILIADEDREGFEAFREDMLSEYSPVGPMEYVLTERIIGLAWRLRRSERMQTEAIETLISKTNSGTEKTDPASDMSLGRISLEDFADTRVIERLSVYELRMERALFKTHLELQRLRMQGKK